MNNVIICILHLAGWIIANAELSMTVSYPLVSSVSDSYIFVSALQLAISKRIILMKIWECNHYNPHPHIKGIKLTKLLTCKTNLCGLVMGSYNNFVFLAPTLHEV